MCFQSILCHHIHKPHPFAELLAERRGQVADPALRLAAQRAGRHREGWVCVSHLFSHPVHLVIHVWVREVHKLQFCPFFYCERIFIN